MAIPKNYKAITTATYNQYAQQFSNKFAELVDTPDVQTKLSTFIKNLPGQKVLDAGAGSGEYAQLFQSHGLDVFCIDISEKMIELCRKKNLHAEIQDIEEYIPLKNSYDGIWAHTSLLHIPKVKLPLVIRRLTHALKHQGLLAITVKEGSGEAPIADERYSNAERFFSYFQDKEMRSYFDTSLTLIYFNRSIASTKSIFLEYIYKKQ